ncbi:MAG: DUF4382 domain-containing protein [Halobacteriales archaeon]
MKFNTAGVVAVVALVALAGCTGFAPGGTPGASPVDDSPETEDPTEQTTDDTEDAGDNSDTDTTSNTDDASNDDTDGTTSDSGTVRFYISDEVNAISEFEHLNVTITEVGFQADGDADDGETETPEDNETETETNETETETETETPEDAENEAKEGDGSGGWIEYEVDDRTFDLTQLQGANASLLGAFNVSEGSYNKVFVHVGGINATLENGESVNVKLPSEKLQITQSFTVAANDSVDFVFDITVHKAGNSGKYILTPVISESGTDVPIEDVDEEREEDVEDGQEDEPDNEREGNETNEVETKLNASFAGAVEPGENATIRVYANGSAVANATVTVGEDVVGETNRTGELTFAVPEDVDELEVVIESATAEVELNVEVADAPPA